MILLKKRLKIPHKHYQFKEFKAHRKMMREIHLFKQVYQIPYYHAK